MKTLFTIVARWIVEVVIVVHIAMAIFIVRSKLGYSDQPTEWAPQLFLYLKLSLTTAIPWGLYCRVKLNLQTDFLKDEEYETLQMYGFAFFVTALFICAINFFWAAPEIRHVELPRYTYEEAKVTWELHSFKEWAPYLASLAPLALWLLAQFIRTCLFLDSIRTVQPKVTQATQPIMASLNEAAMDKIGGCVKDTVIKHLDPVREELKKVKQMLRKVEKKNKKG